MKNKNLWKIVYDLVLLVLLVLMYNKSASGMAFHEIGGLVLLGLFAVHLFYNRKWVVQVGKRIFSKGYKAKQRVMYVLNALLVLAFSIVGVTGLMISKVVLTHEGKNMAMQNLHLGSAALALILIGVHIGLHWQFILQAIKKRLPASAALRRTVAAVLLVVIVGLGGYGTATSSLGRWLVRPFSSAEQMGGPGRGNRENMTEKDAATAPDAATMPDAASMPNAASDEDATSADMAYRQAPTGGRTDMMRGGGNPNDGLNVADMLRVCYTFIPMALLYAFMTAMIERGLTRKRSQSRA